MSTAGETSGEVACRCGHITGSHNPAGCAHCLRGTRPGTIYCGPVQGSPTPDQVVDVGEVATHASENWGGLLSRPSGMTRADHTADTVRAHVAAQRSRDGLVVVGKNHVQEQREIVEAVALQVMRDHAGGGTDWDTWISSCECGWEGSDHLAHQQSALRAALADPTSAAAAT